MATKVLSPGGLQGARGGSLMNYRGAWSSTDSYEVGDIVSYQGALQQCTTKVGASSPVVGKLGGNSTTSAGSFNMTLPAGSAVGDIALIAHHGYSSYPTTPSGWTLLGHASGGSGVYLSVFTKTLASLDVANGYVSVPNTEGQTYFGAGGWVLRAVLTEAIVIATNGTSPAVTPINTGLLFTFAASYSGSGAPTTTGTFLDSFTVLNGYTTQLVGREEATLAGTATSAHAFTNSGSTGMTTAAVPVYMSSAFPTSSFTKTTIPVPVGGTTGQALIKNSGTDLDFGWASAVDSTAAHYRGAYAGGSYIAGDLVTANGKLYVCTSPVSVAATTYIGSSSVATRTSAGNMTLPAGTLAGDVLFLAISTYGGVPQTPSGATVIASGAGVTSNAITSMYRYTITATNITNNYVALLNGSGSVNWNAAGIVLRSPGITDTAIASGSGSAVSAVTPTASAYVFVAGVTNSGTNMALTVTPSLTNEVDVPTGTTGGAVATSLGYQVVTSGASTARTLSNGGASSNFGWIVASVLASSLTTPSPANFTEIAVDTTIDTSATHYKGAFSAASSYAVNDIVTYNNGIYVCGTAVAASTSLNLLGYAGASLVSNGNVNLPVGTKYVVVFVSSYGTSALNTITPVTLGGQTVTIDAALDSRSSGNSARQLNVGHVAYSGSGTTSFSITTPSSGAIAAVAFACFDRVPDSIIVPTGVTGNNNSFSAPAPSAAFVLSGVTARATTYTPGAGTGPATTYSTANTGIAVAQATGSTSAWSLDAADNYAEQLFALVLSTALPTANFTRIGTVQANLIGQNTLNAPSSLLTSAVEYQRLDATTAAFDTTPPQTTTPGLRWTFKKIDSSANVARLLGTFDGATNYSLSSQYKYVTIVTTSTAGVYEIAGNN